MLTFEKTYRIRRTLTAIVALLLAVSMLLCSCNNDPTDPSVSGDPDTESGSATESDTDVTTDADKDLDVVVNGTSFFTIVRSESAGDVAKSCVSLVNNAISEATGAELALSDDYINWDQEVDNTACEILIGKTNREASQKVMSELSYGDWIIKAYENKIVITAWNESALRMACEAFVDYVKENASEGSFKFDAAYVNTKTFDTVMNNVPKYTVASEKSKMQFIDLADENSMIYVDKTNVNEYETYLKVLEDNGYKQYQKRTVNDNVFSIYTGDKYTVSAQFTKSDKAARIIIEPKFSLELFEKKEYTKVCEPAVTMVGLGSYSEIGLFLIFTLEDGRLIVVDGGANVTESLTLIPENLKAASPDPDNVVVAAWIFTHAHEDHAGGFNKWVPTGYKNVKVESFILNFTTREIYEQVNSHGYSESTRRNIKQYYPDATVIKAHVGQVYHFADAEIEVLCAYDTILPTPPDEHNTTSLIFRYKTNGQTITVLGDSYDTSSNRLVSLYGSYLKSDIVNVPHHGMVGATPALYANLNAPVLLWSSSKYAYDKVSNRSYNKKAIELATEIFIADDDVTRLTLPYTVKTEE